MYVLVFKRLPSYSDTTSSFPLITLFNASFQHCDCYDQISGYDPAGYSYDPVIECRLNQGVKQVPRLEKWRLDIVDNYADTGCEMLVSVSLLD